MTFDLQAARDALTEASGVIDGPDAPYNWAALQAMRTGEALLAEVDRLHRYQGLYDQVQEVLDVAHGEDWTDGAGEGIVADVQLLTDQRDEAYAVITRVRALLDASHNEGRTYIRMADIRAALDPAAPST